MVGVWSPNPSENAIWRPNPYSFFFINHLGLLYINMPKTKGYLNHNCNELYSSYSTLRDELVALKKINRAKVRKLA